MCRSCFSWVSLMGKQTKNAQATSPEQPCHCGWTSKQGPDVTIWGEDLRCAKLLVPTSPNFLGGYGYKHTVDGQTILHQLVAIGNIIQHSDYNWHFFHLPHGVHDLEVSASEGYPQVPQDHPKLLIIRKTNALGYPYFGLYLHF